MKGAGPMTKAVRNILTTLLVAALALVVAAPPAAAESNRIGEAKTAVERSPIPRDAKTGILTKADQAVAAGIPSEDVAIIITRSLEQGVEGRHIEGFLDTATKARAQGLPVRLILDRTEQGLTRGVPAEKIGAVTERLAGNLAAAKPIVNRLQAQGVKAPHARTFEDCIETVARAMERSIPQDAIASTGEKVRDRKGSFALFHRAVDTMTTFSGSGMTAGQAAKLVHTAVDKGYSEGDLEAMERYMVDGLRKNRTMNDIVSGMQSRMERGERMHDMQMQDRPGAGPMGSGGMGGMGGGMGGMSGMGGRR